MEGAVPRLLLRSCLRLDVDDVELGAGAAYQFLAEKFCEAESNGFALSGHVEPELSRALDMQVRLLGKEQCKVEVHEVHDVTFTCAFPVLPPAAEARMLGSDSDGSGARRASALATRLRWVGVDAAALAALPRHLVLLLSCLDRGGASDVRLHVETIVRTSETAHFGANAGRREDACHVLHFLSERRRQGNLLVEAVLQGSPASYTISNMNDALDMDRDKQSMQRCPSMPLPSL